MKKTILAITALSLATASPVFAQSPSVTPAPSAGVVAPSSSEAFLQQQKVTDWRASKLIGTSIYGPDNTKIGDVNDVLLDSSGNAHAAVIGVGGFLGVGEKDVAIPFNKLQITPTAAGDKIEKITVSYRKEDLQNAPTFKYIAAASATAPAPRPVNTMPRQ